MTVLSACGVPGATTSATNERTAAGIIVQNAWARPVSVNTAQATAKAGEHGSHGDHVATTATTTPEETAQSGVVGAAYVTIVNNGDAADQLVAVTTDVAEAAELHNVNIQNNIAKMRPVQAIDVPANGEVEFGPGGYHIMLVNVNRTLEPGGTVELTLTFQNAGNMAVTAEVREP